MQIVNLKIERFRGIKSANFTLADHTVFVGDNNAGKSSVLEAIDLVLGPERLNRKGVIDEHDFYAGEYLNPLNQPIDIKIEIIICHLNPEQIRHFNEHLEWWDTINNILVQEPPPEKTDEEGILPALRVSFKGNYDIEEDDFSAKTFFASPKNDSGEQSNFRSSDKRICGFLFLRTLRTGSRALSLERGSLLDIILKLQDKNLQIWEEVLKNLRKVSVANNDELGVGNILKAVQKSLKSFIATDMSDEPNIRVSDLTRESLRKILTVFMDTGAICSDGSRHTAPFQHQGTGTINILVLSLLSIIAELKHNVIFAMEEPEIAIPPHVQKTVIGSVRSKSAQSLFTSHSPYVLEEFDISQIKVLIRKEGILSGHTPGIPPATPIKSYRAEFRKRFCESLLANRILITEGRTEYDALPASARRLNDLDAEKYKTLESLGIAVLDAQTDSQIAPLGNYFSGLGKTIFAIFDQQEITRRKLIEDSILHPFESPENTFEKLILNQVAESALRRFAKKVVDDDEWPLHLKADSPNDSMTLDDLKISLLKLLKYSKGSGIAADILTQCSEAEMPIFIKDTLISIQEKIEQL